MRTSVSEIISSGYSIRYRLNVEISTMASFTTTPTKAITPKPEIMLRVLPTNNNPGNTPISAKGIANMINNGCIYE